MKTPRNQHYVPQFYLRQFATEPGGDAVALYNIDRNRHIPVVSIRHQCAEDYFYGRTPEVEHGLSQVEGIVADVIRRVTAGCAPPARQSRDARLLAAFAALQWGRTPAAVRERAAFESEIRRLIRETPGLSSTDAEAMERRHFPPVSEPGREAVELISQLIASVDDLAVGLVVNESPVEFVTSDVVVVVNNTWCGDVRGVGTNGLGSRGLQMLMPASPRHLIVLYDSEVYKLGTRGSGQVSLTVTDDVQVVNAMQYRYAEGNLYHTGSAASVAAIDRLRGGARAPRRSEVRGQRLRDDDGTEILHVRSETTTGSRFLRWMPVRRAARRVPLDERLAVRQSPFTREWAADAGPVPAELAGRRFKPTQ